MRVKCNGGITYYFCKSCNKWFSEGEFRDKLDLKEFWISGLCPQCQDVFFKVERF